MTHAMEQHLQALAQARELAERAIPESTNTEATMPADWE